MRRPALTSLLVALALLLLPGSALAASCPGAGSRPTSTPTWQAVAATVCLVNNQRTSRGLPALRWNRLLWQAANGHAADMVHRHYFSHTTPGGTTFLDRIRRTGYFSGARWWYAGENIAWGSGSRATPSAIVTAWMNSPGHRANILSRNYRETGVGVVLGSPGGYSSSATYVNDFGARG
jgi:uncharacterized protein YkwD